MKKIPLGMAAALVASSVLVISPAQACGYYGCPPYKPPVKTSGGGGSSGVGPWPIIICAGGIVLAAVIVNAVYDSELDGPGFCGLGSKPATKTKVVKARG
jgi:hypothetical protein